MINHCFLKNEKILLMIDILVGKELYCNETNIIQVFIMYLNVAQ